MKSMKYLRAAVVACAIFAPGTGSYAATTFTVSNQSSGSICGTHGAVNLTIFDDDYRKTGVNVTAGGFAVKGDTNNDGTIEKFTAWCVDITRAVALPTSYFVTNNPFTGYLLSSAQKTAIQKLFDTALASLNLSSNKQSAGFQLALWEIVNEDGGLFNVKEGSFYALASSTLGGDTRNFANQLLAGLNGPKNGHYNLKFLESYNHASQHLVTGDLAPVPLPAGGLLLLSALGGLGMFGRRKARTA